MIRTVCDSCGEEIDTAGVWFGVDHWLPVDDDDELEDEEPMGNTYHFCSAGCMSAWAFTAEIEA